MKIYSKFQMGWILVIVFIPVMIISYWGYKEQWGNNPIDFTGLIILECIMAIGVLLFYGLRVSVYDSFIRVSYGIGIISIKIKLQHIKSIEFVRNPWFYGLGIRYIPGGMLYNIHGRDAIELKFTDSPKIVRIGSDDCENLKNAIETHLMYKN